jgi:DNA-binding response OmpR family regulator
MDILLVEDNRRISEFVVKGLEESGFSVTLADNGTDARSLINQREWNLILLDIMLPDIDGFELLQYTRFKKIQTLILVFSALGEPDDKVKALDYGADDYLANPFHFKELIARINALIRRATLTYDADKNVLECADLKFYLDNHRQSGRFCNHCQRKKKCIGRADIFVTVDFVNLFFDGINCHCTVKPLGVAHSLPSIQ